MKRWLPPVTVAVILGLAVAGCGVREDQAPPNENAAGARPNENTAGVRVEAPLPRYHAPDRLTVTAGKSVVFMVSIERNGYNRDVALWFDDLPKGTRIEGGERQTISKGLEKKTFTLTADANVDQVKDHQMGITLDFSIPKQEDRLAGHNIEVTVLK